MSSSESSAMTCSFFAKTGAQGDFGFKLLPRRWLELCEGQGCVIQPVMLPAIKEVRWQLALVADLADGHLFHMVLAQQICILGGRNLLSTSLAHLRLQAASLSRERTYLLWAGAIHAVSSSAPLGMPPRRNKAGIISELCYVFLRSVAQASGLPNENSQV